MATKKIPQLAARSVALTGDEEVEIAYNSVSYRLTLDNLMKVIGVLPSVDPAPASGYRIPLYQVSDGEPHSCTLAQALSLTNGLESYTVSSAPSAADYGAGAMIYVTDGDSGSPCLAVSDGALWRRIALGAAIAV